MPTNQFQNNLFEQIRKLRPMQWINQWAVGRLLMKLTLSFLRTDPEAARV